MVAHSVWDRGVVSSNLTTPTVCIFTIVKSSMVVMGGKPVKLFLSLGVVAAILPLLLWGVTQAPKLNLQTRAESAQVRLWWEPAQVRINLGKRVKLTLVAEYFNQSKLIPVVKAALRVPEGLRAEPAEISYLQPFSGRVSVGEVVIEADRPGRYELGVLESGVFTGIGSMEIIESPAIIIVE